MSAKKTKSPEKLAAKRPTKKVLEATAEQASKKALETQYMTPMPEISPLGLAHLVVAMGLCDHDDGPAKGLDLVRRCMFRIDRQKAEYERLNGVLAKGGAKVARTLAEIGLSSATADQEFSLKQVITKMPTGPLKIAGKELRGVALWDEFRRQKDPQRGRPGKKGEDGEATEVYSQSDLFKVYKQFKDWRDKIAKANRTKTSANILKANSARKKGI